MKKILFGIFILSSFMFTPLSVVQAKIVPDCNKGPLVPVYKLDSSGKPIKDSKGNQVILEKNFAQPCDFSYVILLLNNVIEFLLFTIASPLAALGLIYAGFKLLTSGGDTEAKTKAKAIVKNIIVGYIVALAAWLIVNTIFKTFDFQGETYLEEPAK